jgi:glutamate carboxypeptidase
MSATKKPPKNGSSQALWTALLARLRRRQPEIIRLLGEFVRLESFSYDKNGVDALAEKVAGEWRKRGARVQILREKQRGNHVRADLWLGRGKSAGQILVLGHLDTVYARGTLARTPFRVSNGYAWGPGTFDMKGGAVLALAAVDALRRTAIAPRKRFVFLWTSDEEIGSGASRKFIQREARRSQAVLVLEPSLGPKGKLKTQRKGVGGIKIEITGRAAHAGINPQTGVNAVHELALQIARLAKMNNPAKGITVQTNVASGGTVSNVVAAEARAEVDVRFAHAGDAAALEKQLLGLKPFLKGARVRVTGGVSRPPLERTAAVAALFEKAKALSQAMGLRLEEGATGGGSDGNFTAALGIPTLDGLGAVGEGAHSPRERVRIRKLPERAALIAALLATL